MLAIVDLESRKFVKLAFTSSPTTLAEPADLSEDLREVEGCSQILILTDDVCELGQGAKDIFPEAEQTLYVSRSLACAYACNQSQAFVVRRSSTDSCIIVPIVDSQLLKHFTRQVSIDMLAEMLWSTALLVNAEYAGKGANALENIILADADIPQAPLQARLQALLPVSTFAGDLQPKRVAFRGMPSFYEPPIRDNLALMPFFGAAIAAKSLLSGQ